MRAEETVPCKVAKCLNHRGRRGRRGRRELHMIGFRGAIDCASERKHPTASFVLRRIPLRPLRPLWFKQLQLQLQFSGRSALRLPRSPPRSATDSTSTVDGAFTSATSRTRSRQRSTTPPGARSSCRMTGASKASSARRILPALAVARSRAASAGTASASPSRRRTAAGSCSSTSTACIATARSGSTTSTSASARTDTARSATS